MDVASSKSIRQVWSECLSELLKSWLGEAVDGNQKPEETPKEPQGTLGAPARDAVAGKQIFFGELSADK